MLFLRVNGGVCINVMDHVYIVYATNQLIFIQFTAVLNLMLSIILHNKYNLFL